ncbi:PREDICTED: MANES_01G203600 partial [Prunus dulcis]|uniref:PREDICTED: MANES_01G203600 partial n=1 Tax=Prunus dulcis TaxID=3755 RepID=A0A5E4GHJ9_PRUDU|nr:PREDICTED: MANES_01G203600 partial [Prunus dulcis]
MVVLVCMPYSIRCDVVAGGTFADIWLELCDRFAGESGRDGPLSSIAYGLWRLWKCRNSLSKELGTETTPVHGGGGEHRRMGTQKWSCPLMAFAKINCDWAWTSQILGGGWGWVIRDAAGVFKGAGGEGGVRCGVAIVVEAEALWAGLCPGMD